MSTPKITVTRQSETVSCNGANGRRSMIEVGAKSWHSIERMDGYKWLRPNTYDATFAEWTAPSGAKSKAIRILNVYNNRIYIHPANEPVQVAGCIAPGTGKTECGVEYSKKALQQIFDSLGGYVANKELKVEVHGSMSDAAADKEPGDTSDIAYHEPDASLMIG